MLLFFGPDPALLDPGAQEVNLFGGQGFAFGGHDLVRVLGSDPRDEFALRVLSGDEKWFA